MTAPRSPTAVMIVAVHLAALVTALCLWVICRSPDLGVRFEAGPNHDQVRMIAASTGAATLLPADAPVTFRAGGEVVLQRAGELRTLFLPSGHPDQQAKWYAARTRMLHLAATGSVQMETVTATGPLSLSLTPKRRALATIGLETWIILLTGLVPCLLAAWLWALRPKDWATRCYGVSSLCLMCMSYTVAIWQMKGLAANGALLWVVSILNFLASTTGFWALAALFLAFPKPIIRPRPIYLLVPGACMAAAAIGPAYLNLNLVFPTVFLSFLAALVFGLAQWQRSKDDPVARTIVNWFGLSLLTGSSIGMVVFVLPRLSGAPPLAPHSFAFIPTMITYGGVAVAVGRYRLFDLDRWSYRVLAAAVGAATLLVFDAALIAVLQIQPRTALGASIVLVTLLYVPLRDLFWRRFAGKVAPIGSALFQQAAEVAFTADPDARRAAWQDMLKDLFQPLQIEAASGDHAHAAIQENGLELVTPAAAGHGPLVLRYLNGGRRLFSEEHLALVNELTSFMARAEGARDAFRRGVMEERGRIARDLHDDVGARLLSGLHRPDPEGVRGDVRAALADMRALVADLAGQEATFDQLMGDLRTETAQRLEAVNVRLDWPPSPSPADTPVSQTIARHLRSACREAISNVIKHARASSVTVRVDYPPGRVRMTITDDGVGLKDESISSPGVGIGNMSRRMEQVGGAVTLRRGETRGVCIDIEAPL